MHKDSIRVFLTALKSKVMPVQSRAGWVIAACPFAPWRHDGGVDKHPSFAVKVKEGGQSMYNCFSCSSHGDLGDMVQDLVLLLSEDKDKKQYDFRTALQLIAAEEDEFDMVIKEYKEADNNDDEIHIFAEWWLDSFVPATQSHKAVKYLMQRGLNMDTIEDLDIRWDSSQKRVCFPIRDWDGFLVGLHGRSVKKNDTLRYYAYGFHEKRNKVPWVGESRIDPDKMVVLCEGPFDMAAIYPVYPNVICSNSASMAKAKVKRIRDLGDIVTLYDHGKGGDAARKALDKYMDSSVIMKHVIPTEEQGDPGNMSEWDIANALGEFD